MIDAYLATLSTPQLWLHLLAFVAASLVAHMAVSRAIDHRVDAATKRRHARLQIDLAAIPDEAT